MKPPTNTQVSRRLGYRPFNAKTPKTTYWTHSRRGLDGSQHMGPLPLTTDLTRLTAEIERLGLGWAVEPARAVRQHAVVFRDVAGKPFREVREDLTGYRRTAQALARALMDFLDGERGELL